MQGWLGHSRYRNHSSGLVFLTMKNLHPFAWTGKKAPGFSVSPSIQWRRGSHGRAQVIRPVIQILMEFSSLLSIWLNR